MSLLARRPNVTNKFLMHRLLKLLAWSAGRRLLQACSLRRTRACPKVLSSPGFSRVPSHSHATRGSTRRGSPSYVIISARPASGDLHVSTRLRTRFTFVVCCKYQVSTELHDEPLADLLSVPLKVHLYSKSHVVDAVHQVPQPSRLVSADAR